MYSNVSQPNNDSSESLLLVDASCSSLRLSDLKVKNEVFCAALDFLSKNCARVIGDERNTVP